MIESKKRKHFFSGIKSGQIMASAVFCLCCLCCHGQRNDISVAVGLSDKGVAGLVSHNMYMDSKNYVQAGIYAAFSEDSFKGDKIPFQVFSAQAGYYRRLYTSRFDGTMLFIGGGLLGGYELVNNGNQDLPSGALITSESGFIYGAFVGIDLYIYITDKLSLVAKTNQYYHPVSDLGEWMQFAGAGVRYIIF